MMKGEERKPAPLPPEPWKVILDPWYSRTQILDSEGCIIAEIVGTDEDAVAIADLLLRAPALESEVVRLRQELKDEIEAANEARDEWLESMNLIEQSRNQWKARTSEKVALLREVVKAARVITDDRYVDEWGKAQIDDDDLVALEDVLRRAGAEAEEENANG